jgi:hypothetical protein
MVPLYYSSFSLLDWPKFPHFTIPLTCKTGTGSSWLRQRCISRSPYTHSPGSCTVKHIILMSWKIQQKSARCHQSLKVHLHKIFCFNWFGQKYPSGLLVDHPKMFLKFWLLGHSACSQYMSAFSQYTCSFILHVLQIHIAKINLKNYLITHIHRKRTDSFCIFSHRFNFIPSILSVSTNSFWVFGKYSQINLIIGIKIICFIVFKGHYFIREGWVN